MIRTVLGIVTNVGVSQVVNNIITTTTPKDLSKVAKVTTKIGAMVIGGYVSTKMTAHAEEAFTNLENQVKETINNINNRGVAE